MAFLCIFAALPGYAFNFDEPAKEIYRALELSELEVRRVFHDLSTTTHPMKIDGAAKISGLVS